MAEKLPLPKKLVSKDNLYCVISHEEIKIVHNSMQSAVVWLMNDKERAALKDYEGIWILTSQGKYKKASALTSLWADGVYYELKAQPSVSHEKTDNLINSTNIPSKLKYKQPYESAAYEGVGVYFYPKYPQYFYIHSRDVSVLKVLTRSELSSQINLLNAKDSLCLTIFEQWLEGAGTVLSIDTETFDPDVPNGPMGLLGWKCNIRMLQIYSPVLDKVLIVDFGGRGNNASEYVRFEYGKILQQQITKRECIFQKCLFDLMVLEFQLGTTFYHTKLRDTMSMSKQLWAGIGQMAHNLESISKRLGVGNPDKSLQKSDFGGHLIPAQYNYGADDTTLTYKCKVELDKRLRQVGNNWEFAQIDNAYGHVCHMMRRFGIYLDPDKLKEIEKATNDYYQSKEDAWFRASGLTSTASSKAIKEWLDDNKIQAPNAQKGTLLALVDKVPELQHLLDAKTAKKRLDYIQGLRKSEAWRGDGCATPGIIVSARQGLGRTSSGDLIKGMSVGINSQNCAKESREYPELPDIRPVFAAPPGYDFVSLDLSGSHGRESVYYAGCEKALKAFQPGEDFHSLNASVIAEACEPTTSPYYTALKSYSSLKVLRGVDGYDNIPEKLAKWAENVLITLPELGSVKGVIKDIQKAAKYYRNIAKTAIYTAINFGGAKRLQAALKGVGIVVPIEVCKTIMEALWKSVPEIRQYIKAKQKMVNESMPYKPEELMLLDTADLDDPELDEEEIAKLRKRPVEFGILTTDCGYSRYMPKYYQTGFNGKPYVSCSITDVSASCWQPPEAKIIKRTQIRILFEYIIPNGYLDIMEDTGYPKVWICNNAHDEIILIAHKSVSLEAATVQKAILDEEWGKEFPTLAGTEGTPADCIGSNWSETK